MLDGSENKDKSYAESLCNGAGNQAIGCCGWGERDRGIRGFILLLPLRLPTPNSLALVPGRSRVRLLDWYLSSRQSAMIKIDQNRSDRNSYRLMIYYIIDYYLLFTQVESHMSNPQPCATTRRGGIMRVCLFACLIHLQSATWWCGNFQMDPILLLWIECARFPPPSSS